MSADSAGILIVGAGQAGGRAAEALRAAGFCGELTVIGGEPHLPYERPQLSKAMLLDRTAAPAFMRSSQEWAALNIDVLTGAAAIDCDLDRRVVGLADGRECRFEKLLIATGTRARRLESLESGGIPVHYLRSLDDAILLREALHPGARVALIGGGVIGLEVAAAAVEIGCLVTVIEAMPDVIAQVGSSAISAYFSKLHRAHGVNILTGVTALRNGGDALELSDGSSCPADIILVGIGVEPAVDIATAIGLSAATGIKVDPRGATEAEGVYAVGDVALQWNLFSGRWMRIENWANAQNQAVATAKCMLGHPDGYAGVPWFWSDQYATNLQVAGSLAGVDEVFRGDAIGSRFSIVGLRDGEIVGAASVNSPKDMGILRRAVAGHVRADRGDLEDPKFELRRLLQK